MDNENLYCSEQIILFFYSEHQREQSCMRYDHVDFVPKSATIEMEKILCISHTTQSKHSDIYTTIQTFNLSQRTVWISLSVLAVIKDVFFLLLVLLFHVSFRLKANNAFSIYICPLFESKVSSF